MTGRRAAVKPKRRKARKSSPAQKRRRRRAVPGRGRGRPPEITREKVEQVTLVLRRGNYTEVAAAFAGIHKDTLYDWMKKGASDREKGRRATLHAQFSDAVEKAMADGEVGLVNVVARAAFGAAATYDAEGRLLSPATVPIWQAAMTLLERKHPNRWGRRTRLEVAGPDEAAGGRPLRVVVDLGAGTPHTVNKPDEE